jgi:hypothetical protein
MVLFDKGLNGLVLWHGDNLPPPLLPLLLYKVGALLTILNSILVRLKLYSSQGIPTY